MYCVRFSNKDKNGVHSSPSFAFLKPYNAVRDIETYSLTYLPTSVINGIEERIGIPMGSIVRNKLTFDKSGMAEELVKTSYGTIWKDGEIVEREINGKKGEVTKNGFHIKHCLVNPEIVFGFDTKEHAEEAFHCTIYLGQMEYMLYPYEIFEISEEEFTDMKGVETYNTDDENEIFCGFNRFKNNEKQYIVIDRKEWD